VKETSKHLIQFCLQARNKHEKFQVAARFQEVSTMEAIYICKPKRKHTHPIIFLHGRNSLASEFAEEFFESQASDDRTLQEIFPTIKWIFPASRMRKSAQFGADMSQWFDMWSVEEPEERGELQLEGLKESVECVLSIVREEAALLGPEKIILGGINQGCATVIYALLFRDMKLGGFIGLSSWLPFQSRLAAIAKSIEKTEQLQSIRSLICDQERGMSIPQTPAIANTATLLETPILLEHCRDDAVVPVNNGRGLCETLRDPGMTITWKEYRDGGHWLNEPEGVDDIVKFLTGTLQ
jgi:lysophospholipase-2